METQYLSSMKYFVCCQNVPSICAIITHLVLCVEIHTIFFMYFINIIPLKYCHIIACIPNPIISVACWTMQGRVVLSPESSLKLTAYPVDLTRGLEWGWSGWSCCFLGPAGNLPLDPQLLRVYCQFFSCILSALCVKAVYMIGDASLN